MRALPSPLRNQLESSVLAARRAAEGASKATIDGLGVFQPDKPRHLNAEQATLRIGLRQKWRQLGGDDEAKPLLVAECAYEQWHRLLFARFLAENNLLLYPTYKVPVTLSECADLAAELGEPDGWSVAARFAAEILPGIFRLDDPCVRLRLAPEGRYALDQILDTLPPEVFTADDALGWVYQFWQKDKKDEVNASERKIGGADLGPVTQLFTENYMVRFLLENSLGGWWAARHPDSLLVKGFDYLRFDEHGRPAVGSFDEWPEHIAEVTVMDPCCGSGHFLVEAFSMLWQMRAEEEGLPPIEAQDAVLRDNLFGLELDARCVQIAMFAVALQAWKAGGGWRRLPVPNIACSGVNVKAPVDEWKALVNGDQRLENALAQLHTLFRDADTLGSLIDPTRPTAVSTPTGVQTSLEDVDWDAIAPFLRRALATEKHDAVHSVLGIDVQSTANAAQLLARRFTLLVTNVPYLAKASQQRALREYAERRYGLADRDLATVFLMRLRELRQPGGALASVLPQSWLYLKSYEVLRRHVLTHDRWNILARLGPGAFEGISGEVVNVCLFISSDSPPTTSHVVSGVDASVVVRPAEKAVLCATADLEAVTQLERLKNSGARFSFADLGVGPLLAVRADSYQGLKTGDNPRFVRSFWEVPDLSEEWCLLQSPVDMTAPFGGRSQILWWSGDGRDLKHSTQARVQGASAWRKRGVLVREMKALPATLYTGEVFESSGIAIVPRQPDDLDAVWAFCSSSAFSTAVRQVDQKLSVATATATQVPFDVDYWREVAAAAGSLPEPWSDNPTQWLFEGRPEVSTAPLQVAVARLVGYRWPEQAESDDLDAFADSDAIVCLPSVAGEAPAADRVQQLLAAAFGDMWSPARVKELLEQTGSRKKTLADWLRDDFFKQHCAMFSNRPFVWHIWDGQRDGFSALVNYHRLDRKALGKLTYTYLGQDWVERQRADARDEVPGAEARLAAALKLRDKLGLILEGEEPYDIYVRWKEPHDQPIGWAPDLNDGIRLNIRPFVKAGVLRSSFNIHWKKDRGKTPNGRERINDLHRTLDEKRQARQRAGRW